MSKPKLTIITFRVSDEEDALINKAAKKLEISKSQLILKALKDYIKKNV